MITMHYLTYVDILTINIYILLIILQKYNWKKFVNAWKFL